MKRFLIGAAAAAALAMPVAGATPAGASAAEAPTAIAAPAIPPCPTTNLSYCVRYWVNSLVSIDGIEVDQCTTPVVPCVEQAIGRAFTTAENAVLLARAYTYYAVDQVDDPPPLQSICYTIWGEPCAAAVAG